jgi:dCTP diphosphatase
MIPENEYDGIAARIRSFCDERDWEQYHNPKNLSMSVAIEAAELMEIFQWLTTEQSEYQKLDSGQKQAVKEEIADIAIYCIRMTQVLKFDMLAAIKEKIDLNEIKYPADKVKGRYKL